MKKNLFYSLMALFVVLFVSCGQEEIVSDNGTEINVLLLSLYRLL